MTFQLGPGVSFCFVEDHAVALDLRRDRYFGLSAAQSEALRGLSCGKAVGKAAAADLSVLLARGLVVTHQGHGDVQPCRYAPPRTSLREDHHGRAGATLADAIEVAIIVLETWAMLRLRPLAWVIEQRQRSRASASRSDTRVSAETLALRFLAVRGLSPIRPRCLLDSLALLRFLTRHGSDADLVLAVAVRPFEAHAWAQLGDRALNETTHRAAMLTPILVV